LIFKLKKGDRFAVTFTERFINDSVYNGVEDLEAFEYKGKIIYAFHMFKIQHQEKWVIMMRMEKR
jgi:hypothetical protein